MKIKVQELEFEKLEDIKPYSHFKIKKMSKILKGVVNLISKKELENNNFKCEYENMDRLDNKTPCLILMNHSSFVDLKIAMKVFKKKDFNIVCTDDGFIGKKWLLRNLGCIPTKKFITDTTMVKDMINAFKKLNSSVLMYPEATYSFDGRSAILPDTIGKFVKLVNMPVVIMITNGAFLKDPLYNNLQLRQVDVSVKVSYALTPEEIKTLTVNEINEKIRSYFTFNAFKYQIDNHIKVDEPFRADNLNRMLYKCPHCEKENVMIGKGINISCSNCHNTYELDEYGSLHNINGETIYSTVYDWYDYEKQKLHEEIDNKTYKLDIAVDIYAMKDMKALYHIGDGRLIHDANGFSLDGCNDKLHYKQNNKVSYSLYSDFYWYELGDMICIGNNTVRYYCVFKDKLDVASKTRLAVEYLYSKKND